MPDAVPQPGVTSRHRLERFLLGAKVFCLIARASIQAEGTYGMNIKDY